MTEIKSLAGQTAIYGVPSVLGRVLNYLLIPLYTYVFQPGEYGTVSVFYAYTSFLIVILTYGMETTFFRFNVSEPDKRRVYSTAMISLVLSTFIFLVLALSFSKNIARWIDYASHPEYIRWFIWIMALDALSAIPFAHLRATNRPGRFALVRMTNITLNISLNLILLLLCPYILKHFHDGFLGKIVGSFYRPKWGIEYIFISNLISRLVSTGPVIRSPF